MAAIQADLETAMEKALHGTPTFFVGDEKYMGQIPDSALDELLDSRSEPRISKNSVD